MSGRRIDVVDELLAAMVRRDPLKVLDVLRHQNPSHAEIEAASDLRRLDLALGAAPWRSEPFSR